MSKTFAADQVRSTKATMGSDTIAGRAFLTQTDNVNNVTQEVQGLLGRGAFQFISPSFGSAGFTGVGVAAVVDGIPTIRVPASTNLCTSLQRTGVVSAAAAGSAAGIRNARLGWWLGNAAGLGGFFGIWRFNISDAALVATANMFAGMRATNGVVIDVAPSTLTNIIGVGCDNGDTHLQLYAAGAAAQPRTDLGASFPVNTTNVDVYELALYAVANAAAVQWQVTRLNTGDTASGTINTAAKLPSSTTFLQQTAWRSNGGTAAAVGIDVESIYMRAQV